LKGIAFLFKKEQYKFLLIAIAIAAIILRLAGILTLGVDGELEKNAFEYGHIAANIADGHGHSFDFYGRYPNAPTAWMEPLYSYLLAGYSLLIGRNLLGVAVIQAIIGGVVCWLIGIIGVALSGGFVGITAAGLFALYPEAIFHPQKFVPEHLLLLLMILIVFFGVEYIKTHQRRFAVIAGILCGIAILTKVSAMSWPVALVVWIWFSKKISRRVIIDSVLIIALAGLVVFPWTFRNYVVMDALIPVRTNFWFNVWRGNNPYATGTPRYFDKNVIESNMPEEYIKAIRSQLTPDETQREKVYRQLAKEYIGENPGQFIKLSIKRLYYFWTRDPTHPLTGSPLYWGPWCLLIILAATGIYSVRNRWRDYSFWYFIIVATTIVYCLTLVLPRYRIPLIPGLVLLAAEGLQAIFKMIFKTDTVGADG